MLDGNKPKHQRRLFSDNNRYKVQPDLIFKHSGAFKMIGEVKYKPKIEEVDRYQLLSHVLATNADIGVWISPTTPGSSEGTEYIGSQAGKRFFHYRIDLNRDIDAGAAKLGDQMITFLSFEAV